MLSCGAETLLFVPELGIFITFGVLTGFDLGACFGIVSGNDTVAFFLCICSTKLFRCSCNCSDF